MKIYTKTGDKGATGLFGGSRVSKNSARIRTIGAIDEANAALGLYKGHFVTEAIISSLQSLLFDIGADLSAPYQESDYIERISPLDTGHIENQIDFYNAELPPLKNFILPTGPLHFARTIIRRAEREFTALLEEEEEDDSSKYINYEIQKTLNRFSDLLFILARYDNLESGKREREWMQKKR